MKKSRKIFAALMIFMGTIGGSCGVEGSYKNISAEEAVKIMQNGKNYLIVDVRTPEEYDKKHIPGALLLPLADIRDEEFDKLPDKNQMLLIYCWTGRRAEEAAKILAENGYTNVYNFGGLVDWKGEIIGTEIKD